MLWIFCTNTREETVQFVGKESYLGLSFIPRQFVFYIHV